MGSWTHSRLHNFLERPKITSKITNGPEKQNNWKWSYLSALIVHSWWPCREELRLGWALIPARGGLRNGEGKEIPIFKASRSSMQSHSKENGKDVMIYNDITWARDWTQVCHIYLSQHTKFRQYEWSIGQAVSEIFILVYFIWQVVHRGVSRGVRVPSL